MHPIWQIPELLCQITSFLAADDISCSFHISHHFSTVLKANLAPRLRPLPDSSHPNTLLSGGRLPQDVRDKAKAYIDRELATPKQLKMEDAYYYWREYARCQVLHVLTPHLHPVLSEHATGLVDGYDSLMEGGMNLCLQINIRYHDLYSLVQGETCEICKMDDFLAVVPPKSVTVFCLGGASWDLSYANLKYRDYGGVKRVSVKVERQRGVRLSNVLDELKGTLMVDGVGGALGQDVSLVWVFNDGCDE